MSRFTLRFVLSDGHPELAALGQVWEDDVDLRPVDDGLVEIARGGRAVAQLDLLRAENEPLLDAVDARQPPNRFRRDMQRLEGQSQLVHGDLKQVLDDLQNGFDDLVDLVYDVQVALIPSQ